MFLLVLLGIRVASSASGLPVCTQRTELWQTSGMLEFSGTLPRQVLCYHFWPNVGVGVEAAGVSITFNYTIANGSSVSVRNGYWGLSSDTVTIFTGNGSTLITVEGQFFVMHTGGSTVDISYWTMSYTSLPGKQIFFARNLTHWAV